MLFEFGKFQVDIDVDTTKAFYRERGKTVLESCGCVNCRNYYESISGVPDNVKRFFAAIGVDPQKTPEATWWDTDENGIAYYTVIFHVVGTIVQAVDIYKPMGENGFQISIEDFYEIDTGFKVGFTSKNILLEKDFPTPSIQLEVDAHIPWVLDL